MIVQRICRTIHKPAFEVMQYPIEEFVFWAACFSIEDNKDRPAFGRTIKNASKHVTVEESIADLKRVLAKWHNVQSPTKSILT